MNLSDFLNDPVVVAIGTLLFFILLRFPYFVEWLTKDKTPRHRSKNLGRAIGLNAWNDRTAYTSGLLTDVDERGNVHVYYHDDHEWQVAEEHFPDGIIEPLTPEIEFGFKHPSYGCRTTNKNDLAYKEM